MRKKHVSLLISVVLLSIALSTAGEALELPDGVVLNEQMSQMALAMAQQQFSMVKDQLAMLSDSLEPDQKTMVEATIQMVQERLDALDRIEIYFATETTPGAAYDSIYSFYQGTLQQVPVEKLQLTVAQPLPANLPQATMDSFTALLNDGKIRAAYGESGKTRLSLSSVYLDLMTDPQVPTVKEGTTLIIAIDK